MTSYVLWISNCCFFGRPYSGDFCSDPQRNLGLPIPSLPNGKPPPGFLGYAVNMIDLDVNFRQWRTASGHGLRETLFYRLFGELQVYENRECMSRASSCIKDNAVSLDGGIMRGNGVISLGYWYVYGIVSFCLFTVCVCVPVKLLLLCVHICGA